MRSPADAANHHLRVERDERGRGVGGIDGDTAIGAEDRVLAVERLRRIGVADVAAGAIARPARAVIPAARILRHVAADRPLIANLRRRRRFGAFEQNPVALAHDGMPNHFGERRHRANLETVADARGYL